MYIKANEICMICKECSLEYMFAFLFKIKLQCSKIKGYFNCSW